MTRQLAARHERHEWRGSSGGSGGSVKVGERERRDALTVAAQRQAIVHRNNSLQESAVKFGKMWRTFGNTKMHASLGPPCGVGMVLVFVITIPIYTVDSEASH